MALPEFRKQPAALDRGKLAIIAGEDQLGPPGSASTS
jgi:hypothetical protein